MVILLYNSTRGKVVKRGILGTIKDDIRTQILGVPILIISIIFLGAIIVPNFESVPLLNRILYIIGYGVLTFIFVWVILLNGFESDAIYEMGVTNRDTYLIDKIFGRTFQPFKTVITVNYGKANYLDLGKRDFLVLIDQYKGQILRPFWAKNYKNHFFRELIHQIKKKCPEARWIPIKYETIKRQ